MALVTGAGSKGGIGAAIALGFVREGAKVAFVDLDKASLDHNVQLATEVAGPGCAMAIVADASEWQQAEQAVKCTITELGGLHILVNNAGTVPRIISTDSAGRSSSGKSWEVSPEEWDRVVRVNVNGPYHFFRAAARHLLEQKWGRVIGITTSLDTMYNKGGVPYGPTKAAHEAMISIFSQELEETGVTANVVTPGGLTNTNQARLATRGYGFSPHAMLQPDIMAAPCIWLATQEADNFTNQRIVARYWDDSLPIEMRLSQAAAPAAWQQLGAQAKLPGL